TDVAVVQRPRVGILSTGDELCRVDEAPGGRIVDSNSWGLMGQVRAAGAVPIRLGFARDERGNIDRLLQAAERCDVVLSSAGVSVGEKDFVRDALEAAGVTLRFWKVAIRPGKPLVFGTRGPRVFFGLPGNPVSSMVTFEQFVRPALRRLMGHAEVRRPRLRAKLLAPVTKGAGLTHLLRAETSLSAGGLETRPLSKQGSGLVTSMAQANSFVVVPAEVTQLAPGAEVEVELFDGALGLSAVSCA
ncbi:MAG: molybdopterin molybdotransferase MoeA, partial [Myxococcales bacterium]